MALRAAPAGAKKPARAAPEALRNLGKPKIPVFLMVGVNCIYGETVSDITQVPCI